MMPPRFAGHKGGRSARPIIRSTLRAVAVEPFRPTHETPAAGLPAWSEPDPRWAAEHTLEPGLPLQLVQSSPDWSRVRCSNGWECWVQTRGIAPTRFRPTHTVPPGGLEYRTAADAALPAAGRLDPGLPVAVVEETMGWAHVQCSNGWGTWVDGRLLARYEATGPSPAGILLPAWLLMAGALVAIVGGFLPWYSAGGSSVDGWDIDVVTLFTHDPSDVNLETGLVLLLVALAALPLVTRRPLSRWPALALAAIATNTAILGFVLWLDFPSPRPSMGVGLVLTALGGVVMAIGATWDLLTPFVAPRSA